MPKVTEEHRAARREQILDAALRCAAREGFHKTTMAHVIAESGLSAGAVYGYFKGKTALIEALAGRSFPAFAGVLSEVAAQPEPVTIEAAFAAVLERVDQLVAESDGALGRVATHAWSEAARDERVAEIVRTNVGKVHQRWVEVLARAERDGTIRQGLDHDRMARALVGLMPGYLVQGLLLGVIDAQSYAAGVADLLTATAVDSAPAQG
jgi:AcrR family transcriptional regulator